MRVIGRVSESRRRFIVPPSTPLEELVSQSGDKMQSVTVDEHGFQLNPTDVRRPVSDLSNNCGLSIAITYEDTLLSKAEKEAMQAGKSFWGFIPGKKTLQ